ncbi:MAG: hypothetical protein AMXMBFR58_19900 [Phycisphaerae bacterium]
MEQWQIYMLVFAILQTLFVFAIGSCVGSLINVLVYRMPLGLSVVTPPSRCPSCQTRLTWRENIPVLGWILLRGRCRFCRVRISPEYPLVEAFVGGMFVLVYWLWFLLPGHWSLGVSVHDLRPEWALEGLLSMWPTLVIVLVLFGSLTAMTLVDAKTSMIPLPLAWVPAAVGLVAHPLHAAWIEHSHGRLFHVAPGWTWTLASPGPRGWLLIGLALGGAVGVVIANILLATGLIRRSWSDYDQWEREHVAARAGTTDKTSPSPADPAAPQPDPFVQDLTDAATPAPSPGLPLSTGAESAPAVATGEPAGASPAESTPAPDPSVRATHPPAEASPGSSFDVPPDSPSDLWLEYPHARREVLKEAMFLAPVVACGLLGMRLAFAYAGPWQPDAFGILMPAKEAPLWLDVLAGALLGYLIGGGLVWMVRILGTLAFGREAMGMGDVHLLAAVGACVGWVDSTLAFFGAAFVGLAYAAVSALFKGFRKAMPYGPHIAVAAVLVVLCKPALEGFLKVILRSQPPVNLP